MTFFDRVFILAKPFREEKEEAGSFDAERLERMAVRVFHG